MTSAFITQVQPQLQQDPNGETAALLRVLIYKIDNTTFGGDTPALPQWTGPPRTVIQVQCVLYASLAASLFSAFLAMLGKQWLNRYASIDMRGSAIERSQNRQRKLDGIIAWYFDHVLESLPLMLQVALLLLGCALSRYLWEIDAVVASVVVGVTLFGVLFYLFIIVVGATSKSCPYHTPWTNITRRLLHLFVKHSLLYLRLSAICGHPDEQEISGPTFTKYGIPIAILLYLLLLPFIFAFDVFRLGQATFRSLVVSAHKARSWLFATSSIPNQVLDEQATKLDFRCISWMLQTSLDKTINLLTFDFLKTIVALPGFDSDIVVDCFNMFNSCLVASYHSSTREPTDYTIPCGSEQLAEISAMCFICAFSHMLVVEPTSTTIGDIRRRYRGTFSRPSSWYSKFPTISNALHHLFTQRWDRRAIEWKHYNPSFDDLVPFAHALAQIAQFEYRGREYEHRKVPRWLVRFALRFLSQDPLPPTSVVVDCLAIVATDLGCIVPDTNRVVSDEKCVHISKTTVPH